MFERPVELLRKIHLEENSLLELRTVRFRGSQVSNPNHDELADELAAFANTHGGVLVFGLDDKTRDVIGISIDNLVTVEHFVYEICNESVQPPILFHSFRMRLPDSTGVSQAVLKIEIPRSLFVHRRSGGYFFRQGSSKRQMPPKYLARLFQHRSQARLIRFEEQPVSQLSIDDLSQQSLLSTQADRPKYPVHAAF